MLMIGTVVGMQYYHTACIFLTLTDPQSIQMNDYQRSRFQRTAEVCLVDVRCLVQLLTNGL